MKRFRILYKVDGRERTDTVDAERYQRSGSDLVFTTSRATGAETWVAAFPADSVVRVETVRGEEATS